MPINHESLVEQITQITNQLSHIKKQLQQEIVRSNDPQATLREENTQLRTELDQVRAAAKVVHTVPVVAEEEEREVHAILREAPKTQQQTTTKK